MSVIQLFSPEGHFCVHLREKDLYVQKVYFKTLVLKKQQLRIHDIFLIFILEVTVIMQMTKNSLYFIMTVTLLLEIPT